MITPRYCVTMARYNAWQNRQVKAAFEALSPEDLTRDRGAFFGSILATANHLLWGDRIWLSRFTGGEPPVGSIAESVGLTTSREDWALERFRVDSALLRWADGLKQVDLAGPLRWQSGVTGREMVKPVGLCVTHMFNHQTHHRGQIHAMLTAAGAEAPVSDLFVLPDEGPWL
ncbi:DinB family protein [Thetidibacter halocola]|uniref:DinB family protein n=1 Tax=Thetidibacter halocola TaxID=2827239 RepID=A0A8J8B6W3_9RHOB|nr:DinB family protein [Thetidibacter halocola]MBS0123064.1 DinB family protein [Thetidibacter halocola]